MKRGVRQRRKLCSENVAGNIALEFCGTKKQIAVSFLQSLLQKKKKTTVWISF
jgi:hypothetical protein